LQIGSPFVFILRFGIGRQKTKSPLTPYCLQTVQFFVDNDAIGFSTVDNFAATKRFSLVDSNAGQKCTAPNTGLAEMAGTVQNESE
jgi:hypothetical protein